MPLYEYACNKCNENFELMKSFNDNNPVKCPKCGTEAKKLISTTSFQLKGTGWYKTDYQNKSSSGHGSACGCCAKKEACSE
jgi:putative FmdB family regulatory protein